MWYLSCHFLWYSANFIKEPGLEINRPDSDTAETQENAAILIAVGTTGEVWMDGRRIDVSKLKLMLKTFS